MGVSRVVRIQDVRPATSLSLMHRYQSPQASLAENTRNLKYQQEVRNEKPRPLQPTLGTWS